MLDAAKGEGRESPLVERVHALFGQLPDFGFRLSLDCRLSLNPKAVLKASFRIRIFGLRDPLAPGLEFFLGMPGKSQGECDDVLLSKSEFQSTLSRAGEEEH